MIGASSADIRLVENFYVEGTEAELPYNKEILPSYYNGKVNNVSLEEKFKSKTNN